MAIVRDAMHGLLSKHFPIRPYGLMLVLTARCNARCVMCQIWQESHQDLPIENFIGLIRQPLFSDIVNVAITGGEPTLRTDMMALIEELFMHMPRLGSLNITTNGFIPSRLESLMKDILQVRDEKNPNVRILTQLSLDGPKDLHDAIRGVPDGFDRVVESRERVSKLFDASSNTELYHLCVIQPSNIDHLNRVDQYFASLKTPVVYNLFCEASYVLPDKTRSPVVTPAMTAKIIEFLKYKLQQPIPRRHKFHYSEILDWLETGKRKRFCGLLTQHAIINHDGSLLPCLNSGSIQYPPPDDSKDLMQFWRSGLRKKINRRVLAEMCPECRAACGPNTFDVILAFLLSSLHLSDKNNG